MSICRRQHLPSNSEKYRSVLSGALLTFPVAIDLPRKNGGLCMRPSWFNSESAITFIDICVHAARAPSNEKIQDTPSKSDITRVWSHAELVLLEGKNFLHKVTHFRLFSYLYCPYYRHRTAEDSLSYNLYPHCRLVWGGGTNKGRRFWLLSWPPQLGVLLPKRVETWP